MSGTIYCFWQIEWDGNLLNCNWKIVGGIILQSFFLQGHIMLFFKLTVQINGAFSWQDLEFNLKVSFIHPPYSPTMPYTPKTEAVFTNFLKYFPNKPMALILLLYACIFNHYLTMLDRFSLSRLVFSNFVKLSMLCSCHSSDN